VSLEDGVMSKNWKMQLKCGIASKMELEERTMKSYGWELVLQWVSKSIQCGLPQRRDGYFAMGQRLLDRINLRNFGGI
jgi:hypothetical protein